MGQFFAQSIQPTASASVPFTARAPNCRNYFFRRSPDQTARVRLYQSNREARILVVRFISQSVAALLLSACAAQPGQPVWVKDGASESDFDKDRRVCTLELQQRPLGAANQKLYDACMSAHGWNQTPQAGMQSARNSPSAF
jgi:hypothetical protein